MMKKIFTVLTVLCLASTITISAAAATKYDTALADAAKIAEKVNVRVNDNIVAFPDAQPFIDDNNRTLIPVRFVAEQLGANVSWDNDKATATIEQNGITVKVQIGNEDLAVVKSGAASTIKMDTVAVLKDDRTYVPIRFVAETLGAWVGYSDLYNAVQIYRDVLTPEEITRLHAYYDKTYEEYCKSRNISNGGITSESMLSTYPQLARFNGTNGFENSNEYKLRNPNTVPTKYTGNKSGITYNANTNSGVDFAKLLLAEARGAEKEINSAGKISVSLKTDLSCVYWSRNAGEILHCVRGILTVTVPKDADLAQIKNLYGVIISDPKAGETRNVDVEVRVFTDKAKGIVVWSYIGALK
jgi:hypothetical protein